MHTLFLACVTAVLGFSRDWGSEGGGMRGEGGNRVGLCSASALPLAYKTSQVNILGLDNKVSLPELNLKP